MNVSSWFVLRGRTSRIRPTHWGLSVLFVGVMVALGLAHWQEQSNADLANSSFDALAMRTVEQVKRRLGMYEYALRGARGAVVSAGIDQLDRSRFRDYSESRDIDREFPGARGVGVIRRVAPADEARFLDAARNDGKPDFAIRALTPHSGDRYVIQYVEPVERNREAVGLDIASERNRLSAANAAMRSGQATITAPITLVQATGKPLRSFLLLLPIYAPGGDRTSPEARAASTVAWSYAPLTIDEVLADFDLASDLALRLQDPGEPEAGVFFATPGYDDNAGDLLLRRLGVPVYGRVWEAELRPTPAFIKNLNLVSPRSVGAAGLLVTVLLAVLSFIYAQSHMRRLQVRSEQARRAAIVDSTNDAIVGETLEGIITDWNHGAELLFGYSAAQALGRRAAELIVPADRNIEDEAIRLAIARGEYVATLDSQRMRADGSRVDVAVTAAPIQDAAGRRVGLSKTIRDITAAKRAALEISELNAGLERQVMERTALLDASRRDLRNILDAVPSLVSYWGRDLRNRFANRAYIDWLGWDPAQMPGKHLSELPGVAFNERLPRYEAALRGEATVFDISLPTLDGGVRHAVTHFLPDIVDGEVQGFYVIAYDVTAQTNARAALAAALRDNEALLGTVNEHAIVSVTDPSGRIIEVNDRFCARSGYAREELLGQTHRLINSGIHGPEFWADVWNTISAGKPWRGEVCNRSKDGALFWVDSMLAPFTGADGTIEKYIAIRIDITEAKQNEQKLLLTKDRIAMATDAAGIGIWEWDVVANVLTWDDWMYRLYGQPATGNKQPYTLWSNHLHPEDRERSEFEIAAALRGEREFDTEFRIVRPDEEVRYLKASARVVRDDQGRPLRMTGVNFDITERRRAALELVETSSLLSSVLESASEVSVIAGDPQLRIKVFNPGAERLLGYQASEIVDRCTPMLFHDPQEVEERAAELSRVSGEKVVGGEAFVHPLALRQPRDWTYLRKDGTRITVSLVVTAMYGKDGRLFGYLGVAHDVTKQKEYETTLRDAMRAAERAKRATSQFLANMSHEIRTPMNAVVGLSHLLRQTQLDAEQAAFLAKIDIASRSLMVLINDVLDVSKIEAGEFTLERAPFSVQTLIAETSDLASAQAHAKRIAFVSQIDPSLPEYVEGDVTRLAQILNNLLGNAIKFTSSGVVTLRVLETARSEKSVNLRFEVEDTGIGIAPNLRARLFSPFTQADASTTRRFGGTGLGLSIVKRLAELMGGNVGLSSELGVGSLFWVSVALDLAQDAACSLRTKTVTWSNNSLRGVRVLIADDSEINLTVAERTLQQVGAVVSSVRNGQEVLDRLLATPNGFDVILMDLHMPVMDGYGACQVIRRKLKLQVPIVALTADARSGERQRSTAAGMNEFLVKPFVPGDLVGCMLKFVQPRDDGPESAHQSAQPIGEQEWGELPGIDISTARAQTLDDCALFRHLIARLLEEYEDVAPPLDAEGASALLVYASRMHKLKGAAGQLGAHGIHGLAARIEVGARDGATDLRELADDLDAQLRELRAHSSRSWLQATPVLSMGDASGLLPALGGSLDSICDQLRRHDLAVLQQVPFLCTWAREASNAETADLLARHLLDLHFGEALTVLEPLLRARASEQTHAADTS